MAIKQKEKTPKNKTPNPAFKKPKPIIKTDNKPFYTTSYKFLEGVGEFCKAKLGYKFPTTWGGFNVSMAPIPGIGDKKRYLFVSRVFLTPEMMYSGKIVVGTKPSPVTQAPHMRPHDYTQNFFWGNWQGTELSVMFVGSFDPSEGLEIDTNYTPFLLTGCKSSFQKPPCVYKQAKDLGIPSMLVYFMSQLSCSDYRVFTKDNDIILHDAYTTFLNKILLNHDQGQIRFEKWVLSMCQLPTSVTGKDIKPEDLLMSGTISGGTARRRQPIRKTLKAEDKVESFKNLIEDGSPYYKYFDKNWSYLGETEGKWLFLDWFYKDGVHGVLLDTESGYCTRKKLVDFKKDIIPRDASKDFPDFSLGTTTMSIAKTTRSKIDVIGVGHVKFHWDYVDFNGSRLYKEVAKIDALFNKKFGRNYKRHIKYVYACFFFRIKQHSANKFSMTMSDLWIPYFENEKDKYHSLVVFPMSVTKSLSDGDKFHVSAGVSDFYNAVLTFDKKQVVESLVHDVEQMDMTKMRLNLVKY